MCRLPQRPTVVRAPCESCSLEVDLLPRVLADVSDVEVAGRSIEAEAPGVAKTVSPDFTPSARAKVWVAGRNRVPPRRAHVDSKHLAEQSCEALAIALRCVPGAAVTAAATVAHADVEQAVRTELDQAAVVVGLRLFDDQQGLPR